MKVTITNAADESLWPIYLYHLKYSQDYADQFQRDLDRFLVDVLGQNPHLGRLYHPARDIRRVVYEKRYNVYYTIREIRSEETLFVLFVFDGRMQVNQDIEDHGLDTDSLID